MPTRRGVEGFVEPRTAVTDVTLLLVAHDGEWTRRRVPVGRVGARVRQPAPVPVVRRRARRHPAADAGLQPPQKQQHGSRPAPQAVGPARRSDRRSRRQLAASARGVVRPASRSPTPVPPSGRGRTARRCCTPARRCRGAPRARPPTNSRRNAAANSAAAPAHPVVLGQVGDLAAVDALVASPRGSASARCASPAVVGRGEHARRRRRRSPITPATLSPSATTMAPVRVATSRITSGFVLGGQRPARRRGSAGPRRRC